MKNIHLEKRTIESNYDKNIVTAPRLLTRYEKGEGIILSEADIRLLGIRNAQELITNSWDTSTLLATKGETVRIILPYETKSRTLTDVARFGLSLINLKEKLFYDGVNNGINLDIENRWEKLEGSGVYTKQRKDWFKKGENGVLIGLNREMTEEEATKCPMLLTKLGHPDYVEPNFKRSKDEIAEIIGKTFELGNQKHMMGQYLQNICDKGILNVWHVGEFKNKRALSSARTHLNDGAGRFAFDILNNNSTNTKNIEIDEARDQLKNLGEIVEFRHLNQINSALDERDLLRKKLLTTDQIYSRIEDHVSPVNKSNVRKILDELTKE